MKYCSLCGAFTTFAIPPGDNLPRHVCQQCQTVHYQNPKVVVGCIPEWQDQILLCKRAIEPRYGLWTFPAGFMENDETIEQAALRETEEEAKANVTLTGLYTVFSIPHVSQVYLVFRGTMKDPTFGAGEESLEVQLFNLDQIPWTEMAFTVIEETLRLYSQDRATGQFPTHVGTIQRGGKKGR
ncbi:NUDIX hydrolase [Candidatus Nitronereus thalassa]|uniref:NUDIX hydrolase n=1 Tax=Candidatus Nitronereus thalassa TaxID=3020898 RepID=A0ABU3KCP8_9BACT|nr:NUDIX hydrolase [Candidatus Nitronereus thalassa]MDT7044212.1 NUDIX hydrolase [Candidatus Nitronereus thalassa]